jgi:serine/threonine protein kinase
MFGDYPPALIKRGRYSDFYFNADGMYHFYWLTCVALTRRSIFLGSLKIPLPVRQPLEQSIKATEIPDAQELTDFLMLMFQLDPTKRVPIKEVLAHKWLRAIELDDSRVRLNFQYLTCWYRSLVPFPGSRLNISDIVLGQIDRFIDFLLSGLRGI